MRHKKNTDESQHERGGEPIADGDDIVRNYEDGTTDTAEERAEAGYNIALTASGGGFVNDEKFDDGGFNAQNNP